MAPRHARDEQPRERWPLNAPRDQDAAAVRLQSRPAAGRHANEEQRVEAPAATNRTGATGVDNPPDRPSAAPGDIDFATYVSQALDRRRNGTDRIAVDDRAPDGSRLADRTDTGTQGGRDRRGTVYQAGDRPSYEDTVLGLHYATAAPRAPVRDERWAGALRTFARAAVWCLPAGVVLLAISSVIGWPTPPVEPSLASPGTWVVVTALGLGLWLVGVVALAALAATSRARWWGVAAVTTSAMGVALLGPVVGVLGLARPAISRTARGVENDPNMAEASRQMLAGLLDHSVGRFLLVAGSVLLALGALTVAGTILGSRVLQRHDGWLFVIGAAIVAVAAFLGWSFLLTLAGMVMLAGALGLAYTASRIGPDGTPPSAY